MGGEHATAIDGEGSKPTEENILAVAGKSDLNRRKAKEIMKEVKTAVIKVIGALQVGNSFRN